jgi:release factor glutamine methyltransferase
LLDSASRRLAAAGVPGSRRDAELLLAQLLSTDRGGLLVRRGEPVDQEVAERYRRWIARREAREPLQHITGEQPFFGLEFKVDGRALVPRPETELLVEAALQLAPVGARVVDLGTGGGCIAVSLARIRRDLRIFALDSSAEALQLARENAERNGVAERVSFVHGDLREPPSEWIGGMRMVVSNPPYVREVEWAALEPEVRDHDPRRALVAGPSGLELYEALLPSARRLLLPGGVLLLELGQGQADAVRERARAGGFRGIEVRPDLRGIPRVLRAVRT